MEQVNLGSVIENAITRFSQNRVGDKPPVFVTLAPALPQIPWKGSALRQFLQFFLYESLLTATPTPPSRLPCVAARCSRTSRRLSAYNHRIGFSCAFPAGACESPNNLSRISSPKSAIAAKNGSAWTARTHAWEFSAPSTRRSSKWFFAWNRAATGCAAICYFPWSINFRFHVFPRLWRSARNREIMTASNRTNKASLSCL
jgi:hypothetical protein